MKEVGEKEIGYDQEWYTNCSCMEKRERSCLGNDCGQSKIVWSEGKGEKDLG